MRTTYSRLNFSIFRSRAITWWTLVAVCWAWLPAVSLAQSAAVRIASLQGSALLNGQITVQGATLKAGDVVETQAGASVILELPDQSQIEVGENTQLDVAELLTADTGARTSRLKLTWGWVRAKLSPDYNKGGEAKFEIETPNALVGVKFSPPDTRVSYDPEKGETVAKGLTNELDVLNKITGERITAPVGATVTVTAAGIVVAAAAGAFSAKALGVTALVGAAAAGGFLALQPEAEEEEPEWSFTGVFKASEQGADYFEEKSFDLTQTGTVIEGLFSFYERDTSGDVQVVCQNKKILGRGNVTETNRAQVNLRPPFVVCTDGYWIHLPNPFKLKLINNGNTLVIENPELELELERVQ